MQKKANSCIYALYELPLEIVLFGVVSFSVVGFGVVDSGVVGFGVVGSGVVGFGVVGFGVVDCGAGVAAQTFMPSAQLCSRLAPHLPIHDPPLPQQVGPSLLGTHTAHSEHKISMWWP